MNSMKVAFFGTSDRTIPILESLNGDRDIHLSLCVTKRDTLVGRKREIRETAVKKWAKENAIPYYEITNINNEKKILDELLVKNGIEICIVADFSFIIPTELINNNAYEMINIHFSLLPKYRGASPIQHAIINAEEKTGVTFQKVSKELERRKSIKS